jgi:AcrR family transcriptional regulator
MPRPRRGDDVLQAALGRFYREGITATGVDALTADAGIAKMTLYNNFGSKDDLVVAYLAERDRRFFAQLDAELAQRRDALDRALAPVDLYERYLHEEGFRGCAFVNAAAELPAQHPGRETISAHKARLRDRWAALIADLDVADASQTARACLCLLEGAYVLGGLAVDDDGLTAARALIVQRLTGDG